MVANHYVTASPNPDRPAFRFGAGMRRERNDEADDGD